MTLKWDVINTDFPVDWQSVSGICDNNLCYGGDGLWDSLTAIRTTGPYTAGVTTGCLYLYMGLSSATSPGCYYLTARLFNAAIPADTALVTWSVCYTPTTTVPAVNKTSAEVSLYPNPATSDINIVFDAGADIKTAAVYNIIGKAMSVYHVTGNSANLNLESIPAGIYFVRLMNTRGDVVTTRKFTKQ